MENKIRHLEMIQGVINRMANNSFLLKGWAIGIISALLILIKTESQTTRYLIAFLPTLTFWVLDSFYLWQEKLFIALYNKVRIKKASNIDFSMSTKSLEKEVESWFAVLFSRTQWMFYIPAFVVVILLLSL